MSVEAPVQPVAPAKAAPPPAPPSPEAQERQVFARVMILLIVPTYFLIVLTLEEQVKHRFPAALIAGALGLGPDRVWAALRVVYRAMVIGLCVVPVVYGMLGVVRLARGGVNPRYFAGMCACFVAGVIEAAAIATAFFWYRVSA